MFKAADVISNVWEMLDDYGRDGEAVWLRFKASKSDNLTQKHRIIDELLKYGPESPLADDLKALKEALYKIE